MKSLISNVKVRRKAESRTHIQERISYIYLRCIRSSPNAEGGGKKGKGDGSSEYFTTTTR